ncbi:MAG: HAD hydrolase-like protein [Bacteroidetes bacterium]|nr:HAD hydrolase-like protein [Bacteroidota bacterium]
MERTPAENIVYIGDNPNKDFIGIKPLGFKTIRVLTGNHRFEKLDNMHEAHLSINSLDEIDNQLLRKLGTT